MRPSDDVEVLRHGDPEWNLWVRNKVSARWPETSPPQSDNSNPDGFKEVMVGFSTQKSLSCDVVAMSVTDAAPVCRELFQQIRDAMTESGATKIAWIIVPETCQRWNLLWAAYARFVPVA